METSNTNWYFVTNRDWSKLPTSWFPNLLCNCITWHAINREQYSNVIIQHLLLYDVISTLSEVLLFSHNDFDSRGLKSCTLLPKMLKKSNLHQWDCRLRCMAIIVPRFPWTYWMQTELIIKNHLDSIDYDPHRILPPSFAL